MNLSEKRFQDLCLKKGFKIKKSSKDEDIYEHWDFKVNNSLVDVKGLKKISRSDNDFNHDETWIEFQNVRGNKGWIKGKADFIAFERMDYFLITRRIDLLEWCRSKIKDLYLVSQPNQALYRLYQRKGRKDIISIIKIKDFMKDIKCWKLK